MKNNSLLFFLLISISASLASCEAIGDLVGAGIWIGIIMVVLVVGIIFWLINKAKK